MAEELEGATSDLVGSSDANWGKLHHFATVAEAIAATTKKLEKAALLGQYFKQLEDVDLNRAARYFAGHQFPMNDSRTTNVGGSIIS